MKYTKYIVVLALALALIGGTAYAGSRINGHDIIKRTVAPGKLSKKTWKKIAALAGERGPQGVAGVAGTTGPVGPAGAVGPEGSPPPPPTEGVVYSNVPGSLVKNLPSLGYQATGTSEFGQLVQLAGTERNNPKIDAVMSVWSCEKGTWNSGCVTTPGSKFTKAVTVSVYERGEGNEVGDLIRSKTETFQFPYRPSSDATCADPTQFKNAEDECQNGQLREISWTLNGTTLPDEVIIGVAFNTQTWGYAPVGSPSPADALNFALRAPPSIGTNPLEADGIYWASKTYADKTGVFGYQEEPGEWDGYQPAIEVTATG